MEKFFWTDYGKSKIAYTDFSGNDHYTFLHDVYEPVSMALVGDEIFWTCSRSTRLNWTPKHSFIGTKTSIIQHPISSPDAMILETITPIRKSKHPCAANENNGCSHICIALGNATASCLCPNGMVFTDSNNKTCITSQDCFFRCGSGECVTESKMCDSRKDCADHSDEHDCGTRRKEHKHCKPLEFACDDGFKCIENQKRCDQTLDCDDKSDELDCDKYNGTTQCNTHQFMCPEGKCIDIVRLCDGYKNCLKGEDEDENHCNKFGTCSVDEYKCMNGQCVPKSWVCDGSSDCEDSSDEMNCSKSGG